MKGGTGMVVREKLVELLRNSPHLDTIKGYKGNDCTFEQGADWLIANGVTLQEWISVEDRLPKPFAPVLVQMPGEEPFPTVRDGFISNDGIWQSAMFRREPGEVTHWKPMPQPPKGE